MNKLAIVGISLIILPIITFTIVFVYCLISTFIHDIKYCGWKYALENNGALFAAISIGLGFVLIAISYCI